MNRHAEISDADLCARIQEDERDAFQQLYNRYARRIYQFSFHYLKNKDESEELVQNVFLKIWLTRKSLDASQNIKAYIFKITVNVIYDSVRHKNVKRAFADLTKMNHTVEDSRTAIKIQMDFETRQRDTACMEFKIC